MTDRRTSKSSVWVRILLIWLAANFLLAGTASWLAGSWYLGWETPPATRMLAEMGLIMLPNLILPAAALRYGWPGPIRSLRHSLGWVWNGWRSVVVGAGAFLLAIGWMAAVESLVGESIPYTLPGSESTIQAHGLVGALGVLVLLVTFVLLTVAAEETMFRDFIQAQVGERCGVWTGFLMGALLFGLARHFGRSTYAPAIMHALLLVVSLFGW